MNAETLVQLFRADRSVIEIDLGGSVGVLPVVVEADTEGSAPACRCWRCGALLTVGSVVVSWDRIVGHRPECRVCLAHAEQRATPGDDL